MKRNLMKLFIILSIAVLFGTGSAWAGGRNHYPNHHNNGSHFRGYHHNGHGWGYKHHGPRYYHQRHQRYYDHGPRYYHYRHYGPPARYYYDDYYYPRYWGQYDGAYYFSGGFAQPGVGFAFGTHGNW